MTWSGSSVFRSFTTDKVNNVNTMNFATNAQKVALYGTTPTPDKDATAALSAYAATSSQWIAGNEITSSTQWPVGGTALASKAVTNPSTGVVMAAAANTASGSTATLSAVFGGLVYDTVTTAVANQAWCFNYFGGSNSVTAGTFTIVWNANGIFRITST